MSMDAHASCANCGSTATRNYCAECGQRVGHGLHSIGHFLGEVIEDFTHADSRLWQTVLALLFKPGFLTAEFLAGRRVRYMPPLRTYLVLSVFFFLMAAATHQTIHFAVLSPENKPVTLDQAQSEQVCQKIEWSWMRAACLKGSADHGRSLQEAFMHNLPKGLFLAVPLLALVMTPLYRRPRRYYMEHLLFLLHDHAFLFLVLGVYSLVRVNIFGWAVALYIPYYYFIAMRRVYGQSNGVTAGKLVVLAIGYLITAILVLAATTLYAVSVAAN